MDLTPETLRSATFRDKLRGYHPDDVDVFLESVARGLEVLLARLRDASEKARAVAPAEEAPRNDDAVKTLALAQRTADLAIHEAKTEAERLVRSAEQKARRTIASAEDSAVQIAEQAQAELRADLERLQNVRDQLFGEVKALGSWLDGERGRIKRALVEVADRLEHMRESGDTPAVKPVNLPTPPKEKLATARAAKKKAAPAPAPVAEPAAAPVDPAPAPSPVAETAPEPAAEPAPKSAPAPAAEHEPERAAPVVERPKAAVTPPVAAPSPNPKHTPPKGQPAVQAPRPAQRPASTREPLPAPVMMGEAGVLSRAQGEAVTTGDDDDPFFAELRAAMLDQSPLGPRDDDEPAG
jgi:DivIVA domain-containing protein